MTNEPLMRPGICQRCHRPLDDHTFRGVPVAMEFNGGSSEKGDGGGYEGDSRDTEKARTGESTNYPIPEGGAQCLPGVGLPPPSGPKGSWHYPPLEPSR